MGLRKKSPAAGEFLFEIDPEPLQEQVTALGGIPLLVRAARSLDVADSVERHLRLKAFLIRHLNSFLCRATWLVP